ncbi:hypothetical protein [Nitratireductor soli]|uniref:hypothetical protein n=1 Tax=Nitratireductor soli TaxID=1670619 RepID=UPI0012FC0D86|nr:hypothetical protein [Nitratireductor soli]
MPNAADDACFERRAVPTAVKERIWHGCSANQRCFVQKTYKNTVEIDFILNTIDFIGAARSIEPLRTRQWRNWRAATGGGETIRIGGASCQGGIS